MKNHKFLWVIAIYLFAYQVSAQSEKAINLYSQGNQALQAGHYTDAFNAFDQAIQLSPDVYPFLYNRGIAALMLHKDSLAIADFKKAAELDPSSEDAFASLGTAYNETHQYTKAIEAYNRALVINPKNGEITDKKALSLVFADKRQEACATFDKAIELGASMAQVHKDTYCKKEYR